MSADTFAKKIKELTGGHDAQYTEDFFAAKFGSSQSNIATHLQAAGARGSKTTISTQFSDNDIDESWLQDNTQYDGQLAVDVFQTDDSIVISSTVAGVRAEDVDINLQGDMITIRGVRRQKFPSIDADQYFIQECFWGGFSRSIILPLDIQHDQIDATLEHGVLTILLPKAKKARNGKIEIKDISR